ncbi:hypothetical protein [Streptomyces sp. NBC_00582]|uniref:hypothetical protein n=1 Tax=Streptomyces sp. NBC_00582 TaxID=2975783 RepID=UPI002E8001F8|nr:hypothetical protein [Streptomyces sp. NBC_00582]WUB67069.1 hypothetical protein OG852_45035 [Streptomyces sp. NBC_00582]
MHTIRHILLVLAGLLVLAFVDTMGSALSVALALTVCVAVNRSAALFRESRNAGLIITTLLVLSLALSLGSAVVLFMTRGWIAALAFVVLFLLYFGSAEPSYARARRRAEALRDALLELVRARLARTVTEEQLTARADRLLKEQLRGPDFYGSAGREALTSPKGMTQEEHRRLLQVLQRHLASIERRQPPSRLHKAVRQRLEAV